MRNLFNSVQLHDAKSNMFDLSHDVKLSLNMGELVPIMCTECVPGDRFKLSCESMIRFAPLVSPVMHRMDVTMHYFFVPNRILWPNWQNYITNTPDPTTDLPHAFPVVTINPTTYSRLCDYLGLPDPTGMADPEIVSALPFAAYQKIFDEYYRDQNLIPEIITGGVELIDGSNNTNFDNILNVLKNRAWEHDYFTSALPWAQKGDPVDVPLGDVVLDQTAEGTPGRIKKAADYQDPADTGPLGVNGGVATFVSDFGGVGDPSVYDPNGTLTVAATTINDLRRAFRLQEWLERMALGGSRYTEVIRAHFNVTSSDKRLQRPEYITGSKSPVIISEVVNTTGTVDAPQGEMAGHGVSVTTGNYGHYFCEEHGYIMGIMSVMPKTAYQQGIPKHFLKINDATDFFWPSFANIGEQAITKNEIYAYDGNSDEVFGYIPRYSEYKFENNRVAGDFRTTLDFWHLGRKFDGPPGLNDGFITADPTHRVFAVTNPDVQKLYAHVYNKIKAVRKMPKYGTPQF